MVDRILTAGREVLLERGYERTTTGRIATKAGISPGSLYDYFPNKEAILAQILDRYNDRLYCHIKDALATSFDRRTDADAVSGLIAVLLDALESDVGLLRVVQEHLPHSANPQRADFARRIDQLIATELLSEMGFTTKPAGAAAWILVRGIAAIATDYVLNPPEISREVLINELTDLVTRYLSGRDQGGRPPAPASIVDRS
jgi:AcrR family transcriptional regulator